jgi:KDO2-lipid IV(A) lauroyltransferase
MEPLLYWLARGCIALIQALPLRSVARFGRFAGGLAFWLDGRHRKVALNNLTLCFASEKTPQEIRSLAKENFRRIGESYVCAIKTASMSKEALAPHVQFIFPEGFAAARDGDRLRNAVVAIGHFGNFELYARYTEFGCELQGATTYRGLRQDSLNRLLQSLRQRSGCLFFERRFEAAALKQRMNQRGVLLGLLADQHAGESGIRLPFLGHDCSTSTAPAVFALRYEAALCTGICYRVGLAQWRLEAGTGIPTHENGRPRSVASLMLEVNRAFETAVRRDPANWFWVHNRWKLLKRAVATGGSPQPASRTTSAVDTAKGG